MISNLNIKIGDLVKVGIVADRSEADNTLT